MIVRGKGRAARRNIQRFPEDFLFALTKQEVRDLTSQIVTSNWGSTRYPPMAFTEQGVAMLSSVLKSERAIEVNIAIIRTFVQMRQLLTSNEEFANKLSELEKRLLEHDEQFQVVFEAIRQLLK